LIEARQGTAAMVKKSYLTLDEVHAIVTEKIPEGVNLEYKSSSILIDRDANAVCKAVSAFANSVGGIFVIGIETKNQKPVRLDDGTPGPSKCDWIHQIINGGTFPAVESVDIREFPTGTGSIYVIDVPTSPQAPHQSNDRKYYKRRGSHSEVMEHYEIEDVRNRPRRPLIPLRAELHTQSILAYLRLTNVHDTDSISDLQCSIHANFDLGRGGLKLLRERGLRELLPKSELYFLIGSIIEILQKTEPEITFGFTYSFHEQRGHQSISLYLADLNQTAIMKEPIEMAIEKLGEKIDNVTRQLDRLQQTAQTLTGIADGSGLRLSQRTLRSLKNLPQLFDPREFDANGYSIVADISIDDAYMLHRIFWYFNAPQAKDQYDQIAQDVRERFEQHFKVAFE
jgi:hypothetical protein